MDKTTIKENASSILDDIFSVIPNSFLILGSALGAVRDSDFIVNNMFDIDIGIMSDDFKWEYITELVRKGFNIRLVLGQRNYGLSVHLERNDIHVDILLFYKDKDKIWSISWFLNSELHQEFSHEAFIVEEREVFGKRVRSLGEKYVEEYYGKNWKIPQEEFDWRNEPRSIKKIKEDPHFKETGFNIYMTDERDRLLETIL
jgi:hypothetical protein